MTTTRAHYLVLVGAGLAGLVWFDNQATDEAVSDRSRPASELATAEASTASEASESDSEPNMDMVASDEEDTLSEAGEDGRIGNPHASLEKEQLSDTINRPLFAPSRRRPPPADAARPADQSVAQTPPENYELVGVVRDGDRAIALLRRKADGASFRTEVGDTIDGWLVTKISAVSALLKGADGSSHTATLVRR